MSPHMAVSHSHVLLGWTHPVFTRFGDNMLPGRMVCSLCRTKHGVWWAAPGSNPADGMGGHKIWARRCCLLLTVFSFVRTSRENEYRASSGEHVPLMGQKEGVHSMKAFASPFYRSWKRFRRWCSVMAGVERTEAVCQVNYRHHLPDVLSTSCPLPFPGVTQVCQNCGGFPEEVEDTSIEIPGPSVCRFGSLTAILGCSALEKATTPQCTMLSLIPET